jgi:hypothetical protein
MHNNTLPARTIIDDQVSLENDGVLFAAGPFWTNDERECAGEGMIVIRADSIGHAKQMPTMTPCIRAALEHTLCAVGSLMRGHRLLHSVSQLDDLSWNSLGRGGSGVLNAIGNTITLLKLPKLEREAITSGELRDHYLGIGGKPSNKVHFHFT